MPRACATQTGGDVDSCGPRDAAAGTNVAMDKVELPSQNRKLSCACGAAELESTHRP